MSSLNKAMIIGRLGQDPELNYTQSNTAVTNIGVATERRVKKQNGDGYESETEWIRVVLWGRLAEIIGEYCKKGSQIYVEGPIQTREWEDKEGVKRYTTEVNADKLVLLGGNDGGNRNTQSAPAQNQPAQTVTDVPANFDDLDDDLPF